MWFLAVTFLGVYFFPLFWDLFFVGRVGDDDDRALDAEEGCVSASATGEWVHDAGGCATVSGVEAVSSFFAGAVVCGTA